MRTPERRTIAGTSYEITPLPARESMRVWLRLLKMVAPGVDTLQSVAQVKAALAQGFGKVLQEISIDAVLELAAQFAKHTQVEFGPDRWVTLKDHFDGHFQGDPYGCWAWLLAALEVEYGPLLNGLLTAAPASPPARAASPERASGPAGSA